MKKKKKNCICLWTVSVFPSREKPITASVWPHVPEGRPLLWRSHCQSGRPQQLLMGGKKVFAGSQIKYPCFQFWCLHEKKKKKKKLCIFGQLIYFSWLLVTYKSQELTQIFSKVFFLVLKSLIFVNIQVITATFNHSL